MLLSEGDYSKMTTASEPKSQGCESRGDEAYFCTIATMNSTASGESMKFRSVASCSMSYTSDEFYIPFAALKKMLRHPVPIHHLPVEIWGTDGRR